MSARLRTQSLSFLAFTEESAGSYFPTAAPGLKNSLQDCVDRACEHLSPTDHCQPMLRALAGAIGEADQFLAAFRRRADQHEDALLFVLQACFEMDAIRPDVN